MIRAFADKALESFYYDGPGSASRGIPASVHKVLQRKLDQLNVARTLTDLKVPPANRLEALKGDLAGMYSIRVNDQWRIIFRWIDNAPQDVSFVDYH
jgi:proteic killer suppression protein